MRTFGEESEIIRRAGTVDLGLLTPEDNISARMTCLYHWPEMRWIAWADRVLGLDHPYKTASMRVDFSRRDAMVMGEELLVKYLADVERYARNFLRRFKYAELPSYKDGQEPPFFNCGVITLEGFQVDESQYEQWVSENKQEPVATSSGGMSDAEFFFGKRDGDGSDN